MLYNGNFQTCFFILCGLFMFVKHVNSLKFVSKDQYNENLQVVTSTGIVQGKYRKTNQNVSYFSYEGIPYAKPPLGDLRFRSPQQMKPWNGVLNATTHGAACFQTVINIRNITILGDEDCLYLNIYTPINIKFVQQQVPVVFFFYGGAFIFGSGSDYKSDNLINNGLIVVTVNYRVGVLGFLSTEDFNSPGNYGLKDQNAALRWGYENIQQFGGDPLKITISGHSAGAISVMYHLISPKSKGLFSRAIAWSGDCTSPWAYQKNPKKIATDMAINLGIHFENVTEMVENLRKTDVNDLIRAQINVFYVNIINIFRDGAIFTPTVEPEHDDAFITENFVDVLKKKKFDYSIPVMMGITTMEAGLFTEVWNLLFPVFALFDISPSFIPNSNSNNISFIKNRHNGLKILDKYFKSKSMLKATSEEIITYFTDLIFTKPLMDTLRILSPDTPVYFFVNGFADSYTKILLGKIESSFFDTTLPGPIHGEDLYLIWNYKTFVSPPNRKYLVNMFSRMWFNFANSGNPTPKIDPILNNITWPTVDDLQNIPYLLLDDEPKIAYNFKRDVVEFWDALEK